MDYQTSERMALKKKAIPLPDLKQKTVLDIGCDHGWWCWEAVGLGASSVLGLDRNRKINGSDFDLIAFNSAVAKNRGDPCEFRKINLGVQWHEFGKHDVTFCFSMYHHVYQNCADHNSIWYWFWRHTDEVLIWENPVSTDDPVVRMHVTHPYNEQDIRRAAERYFEIEDVGPALHVPTRTVWRCWPKLRDRKTYKAKMQKGIGGSTKAFDHDDGQRRKHISDILGERIISGSLNTRTDKPFHWDEDYYRSYITDPVDRKNIDGPWAFRPMRFYPVDACILRTLGAYALRFENEKYDQNFVELIANHRLRDTRPETFIIE